MRHYSLTEGDVLVKSNGELFEGPVWDDRNQSILWVDLLKGDIHQTYLADSQDEVIARVGRSVGAVVPAVDGSLLAVSRGSIVRLFADGSSKEITELESSDVLRRPNDGKCDRFGRFWFSTLDEKGDSETGRLYCLSGQSLTVTSEGFGVPNGLGWSPDGSIFYCADSRSGRIDRWKVRDGVLVRDSRSTLIQFDVGRGVPDGMAIDQDGRLWIAVWDGWRVECYSPDGGLEAVIEAPVRRPTSCAFVGPTLDKLVITSARFGLTDDQLVEETLSGSLFLIDVGTSGVPVGEFVVVGDM